MEQFMKNQVGTIKSLQSSTIERKPARNDIEYATNLK
jgi:hypothetical protein